MEKQEDIIKVTPIRIRPAAMRKFRALAVGCDVSQPDLFGYIVHSFASRFDSMKERIGLPTWNAEHDPKLLFLMFEHDMGRLTDEQFNEETRKFVE